MATSGREKEEAALILAKISCLATVTQSHFVFAHRKYSTRKLGLIPTSVFSLELIIKNTPPPTFAEYGTNQGLDFVDTPQVEMLQLDPSVQMQMKHVLN